MSHLIKNRLNIFLPKKNCIFYLLAFALATLLDLAFGTIMSPDSSSYISYSIERPPLYPGIISLFKIVFGSYGIKSLIFFQLYGGLSVCAWVVYKLDELFQGIHSSKFLVFLVLVFPYCVHPYYGNTILSEAIAYPLFLIMFICVLEVIINNRKQYLYALPIAISLLILTRAQFFFMVPWFVLFCFYMIFLRRDIINRPVAIMLMLLCTILPITIDKTARYFVHGTFSSPPYLMQQLLMVPLVASDIKAADSISDPGMRALFIEIKTKMKSVGINDSSRRNPIIQAYANYNIYYGAFYYDIVNPIIDKAGIHTAAAKESFAKALYIILIKDKHTLYSTIILYGINIMHVWGGKYWVILNVLVFMGSVCLYWQKRERYSLVLFFIILMNLINITLIAILESSEDRYTFCTDTLSVVIIIILLGKLWDNNLNFSPDRIER